MPLMMSREAHYTVKSSEAYLEEQLSYWKQSVKDWEEWIDSILWRVKYEMGRGEWDNEALNDLDERLEKCMECHAAAVNRVRLYTLSLRIKRNEEKKAA